MQQRTKAPCRTNSHGATVGVGRDQLDFGKQTYLGSVRPQTGRAARPLSLSLSQGQVSGAVSTQVGERVCGRGGVREEGADEGRGQRSLGTGLEAGVRVRRWAERISVRAQATQLPSPSPKESQGPSRAEKPGSKRMPLEALGVGSTEEPGRHRPTWGVGQSWWV